ncbi:MAG: CAAX prenyl protease-related protein [Verrucomicrobia bacterium]|nr:CAAX prenyl protease-related protein [Verrucomicrobiota bacterium]
MTSLQGQFGEESRYWLYLAKTVLAVWMIWVIRPLVSEMKWAFSWEAVVVGVGVFAVWVGLDGLYPSLNELLARIGFELSSEPAKAWNPHVQFGEGSTLALLFIVVRIIGPVLVVPPLEEVFYRSFLYRWIVKPDFESVPLNRFNLKAFAFTALIFGFVHDQWLAGILCAMAYQFLVIRKNRLGDAMTAHAITNLLLGVWVIWRGAWNFW